jgi:GWxTD domain-containing protein
MLKGSSEVKMEAFKSYWDDRDPTPETVFNELMYEYYRRIDDAAFRFRTGQIPYPDGLRTDAAHIYVVYGPPDDIASSLPPSGGVEQTWTYADGRRFIFWAASSLDPLELQERAMR